MKNLRDAGLPQGNKRGSRKRGKGAATSNEPPQREIDSWLIHQGMLQGDLHQRLAHRGLHGIVWVERQLVALQQVCRQCGQPDPLCSLAADAPGRASQ